MSNARNLARLLPNASGQLTDAFLSDMAASKLSGSRGLPKTVVPAGTVLQVVQGRNDSIGTTVNGQGVVLDACAVSITPMSSTSKILLVSQVFASGAGHNPGACSVFFLRNGTAIGQSSQTGTGVVAIGSMVQSAGYSDGDQMGIGSISYLDNPGTTSSITYTTRIAFRTDSTVSLRLNMAWNYSTNNQGFLTPCVSTIMALEVAG